MADLLRDFPQLDVDDAAAILGNIGGESGGFTLMQEQRPTVPGSRGGYGWMQWTGPRRRAFEQWCEDQDIDPSSDEANYGYLCLELKGSEKAAIPAVIRAEGLRNKVIAFERSFERAGIPHYDSRVNWADIALEEYEKGDERKPDMSKPDDPPWLKAAFKDLGLHEIPGPKHNARVLEMFKKAGHPEVHDDETAWCAAAVGCWLAEGKQPNSGSLMARSYEEYGRDLDLDEKLPRGAIIVWPRGAPPSGHVNIVVEDNGKELACIGGNQSDSVSIMRSAKRSAIAARWPEDYPLPGETPPPPDVEPVDPDDKLPWWRRWFKWILGGGLGGLTFGSITVDANLIYAVGTVAVVGAMVYVYAIPPRGKLRK